MNMKIKDLIEILNKMDAEKDITISEYDFKLGKWNRHVLEVSYIADNPQEVANEKKSYEKVDSSRILLLRKGC